MGNWRGRAFVVGWSLRRCCECLGGGVRRVGSSCSVEPRSKGRARALVRDEKDEKIETGNWVGRTCDH
jgi:hypothetical protein